MQAKAPYFRKTSESEVGEVPQSQGLPPTHRRLRVLGLFLVGAVLSLGGFLLTRNLLQREVRTEFQAAAQERTRSIARGFEEGFQDVEVLRALFEASGEVTAEDFQTFTAPMLVRHPSVQALQWLPKVHPGNRRHLEAAGRKTHPGFQFFQLDGQGQVLPVPLGQTFYAIQFVVPYARNEATLGYSAQQVPTRQRALQEALETGALTATGRIRLLQETGNQFGLLVLAPIRRGAYQGQGLVQAVFRLGDLVQTSLKTLEPRGLTVTVLDAHAPEAETSLHQELSRLPPRSAGPPSDLRWQQSFDLAGRQWQVVVTPAAGYYDLRASWQAWAVGLLGLAFSLLLAGYVNTLLNRQEAIREQVRLRTQELSQEVLSHRRDAEALRDSEARFHQLVELMDEGMWVLDPEGQTTFVNPRMAQMLGYEASEMLGRSLFEFMPPEEVPAAQRNLEARRGGIGAQHDFRFKCKNGRDLWAIVAGTPILAEDGHTVSILGMITDITQRRQEEQGQRDSQKLESLGVLAGGIAHDFNNLLTAILGNINLAQLTLPKLSPAWPYLETMERTVQRATHLTRQMLAYSGKGRFVVEPLDLNQAVQEISHLLGVSISKKVALRYQLQPELPSMMAEASQIQQVVMNLVTNASEAIGDEEGIVSIRTGTQAYREDELRRDFPSQAIEPGAFLTLEVSDTGKGMSADVLARIFEPFFTTKFTGRGLGLSAMQGIVRGHQGGIRVYSEVGKGTTFRLIFPASPTTLTDAQPAEPEPEMIGSGTLLVVDDEPSVCQVAKELLGSLGFEVLTAADGLEALERFERHPTPIRAVLLDLTMPRLNGLETFRELRKRDPHCRVILTSGYNEQEAIQAFIGKGLAAFVQKPFQREDLIAALRLALEG